MEIPMEYCSGGWWLSLYACGICKHLAIDPVLHDGGYGQYFCRAVFCGNCVSSMSKNPYVDRVKGSKGEMLVVCPSGGRCNKSFEQPFFRSLSPHEQTDYNTITVDCPRCSLNVGIQHYFVHRPRCLMNTKPSSLMLNKRADVDLFVERRNRFESISDNMLQIEGDSLFSPGKELFLTSFVHGDGVSFIRGEYNESIDDFFKKLSNKIIGGPDSDQLDVLCLVHRSIRGSGSMAKFFSDLPNGVPLFLIKKKPVLLKDDMLGVWRFLHVSQSSMLSSLNLGAQGVSGVEP